MRGILVVGVLAVVDQHGGAACQIESRDPLRLELVEVHTERWFVVGDVTERGVALRDPVAERRSAMADRGGAYGGRADLPFRLRRVAEGHLTGQLADLDRR